MTQAAMGGQPPIPPGIFIAKRKGKLTLTSYSNRTVQAGTPMTVPEEGVSSTILRAKHFISFGYEYPGGAEGGGSAPSPLAAGAGHA